MDYTFVPQYNGEASQKRRRLAKACETCRARKKRCHHNPLHEDEIEKSDADEQDVEDPNIAAMAAATRRGRSAAAAYTGISVRKGHSNRFLSDLTPETRLLERPLTNGENDRAKSMDSVGIWVNKTEYELLVKQRDAARGAEARHDSSETAVPSPVKLSSTQLDGILDVYFRKIHPFLPLVEEEDFRQAYTAGSIPEPFVQAMCLVTVKTKEAQQILAPDSGTDWSPRLLCRSLQASVKAVVSSGTSHLDKTTLICILALLSMHGETSDGAEGASIYLVQALHHCQILGLHLSASLPERDSKHTKRLFWCLWILDRFSAATGGRPIMMADNDIAIERFQPGESGFPAFEILLKITAILNEVIGYYRPGNPPTTTGWEQAFPGFEEIVDSIPAWSLPANVLSTLHVAYLAVAILSHRSKGTATFPSTTPSYVRQSLAAIKIIRLMSLERLASLHPLPILPYAISLALSVSYQHLRQDQLLHQQEDARADFRACYLILKELRCTWSSADAMSTLSERVVDELDRVPDLTSFRIRKPASRLEGFTSACKHDGQAVSLAGGTLTSMLPQEVQQLYTPAGTSSDAVLGIGLFAGIDDIFGTYLDPNYPVNLDLLDDMGNLDTSDWITADGQTTRD